MGGSSGMDFFGHQEQARSASKRLVFLFVLALAGIVTCVYVAAQLLLVATDNGRGGFFDPAVFAVVAIGTLAVVGIAMLFKTAQLKSGGGKVAELLGGRAIEPGTHDPKERMLRNLVEEMAIASGVPVPDVFVLDDEAGLNAFAAGWSSADAAVAVTRGCLETLDRDELQGVIAHEFSHVFHGDMRLNIRLMGVLFGIVCLATIGRILVRTLGRGGGNKKGGAAAIAMFGLCLMLIGWIGVLFARLIQAAVSRQREFLADASAVQYTRNPRGIGMALAKIGGLSAQLQSPHTEEASHMLFADGVRRFIGGALATHPPLEQRIERVLPGFRRHLGKGQSL
ncbi:MAG: M48 family metallopeptidase, partial [Planctomycetota bacterium]